MSCSGASCARPRCARDAAEGMDARVDGRPAQAFPGKGVMKPEQTEIERLRKEVAKLKMECDILKKAAAFFAKESM